MHIFEQSFKSATQIVCHFHHPNFWRFPDAQNDKIPLLLALSHLHGNVIFFIYSVILFLSCVNVNGLNSISVLLISLKSSGKKFGFYDSQRYSDKVALYEPIFKQHIFHWIKI